MFTELDVTGPASVVDEAADAAQLFYCDLLGGRPIRAVPAAAARELWFLVGRALVKTGPQVRGGSARIALWVEAAEDTAARCWDAGFTVRVHPGEPGSPELTVIDPFGLEIALRGGTSARGVP
jgi:catechol 2,3-dioxygenase-like lactoylglutathione lyase family enzyme